MQSKIKDCDDTTPAEEGPPLNEHPPHALPPFDIDALRRPRKKRKVKESIIDHTYRDYSTIEVPRDEKEETRAKKANLTFPVLFPAKLHAIVSNPQYSHIIRWQPHGRSWKIVDKNLLTAIILPAHFTHGKFESFNRSVNGWGFKRLWSEGPDKNTYYHECFLQGRPELTPLIQRLNNPGKRLPHKSGEPDFYEISKKYPLPMTLPPAPPSGVSRGQNPPLSSPKNARPSGQQPVLFSSPLHPQADGYPNPFLQSYSPHSLMIGPSPQQAQQMYRPNPALPPPILYGYYPYPPTMMAPQPVVQRPGMVQAVPQGYYIVPPYHPPAAHCFPNTPTIAAAMPATTSAGTAAPTTMPGQSVANTVTSDTVSKRVGADEVTPTAPSATEAAAAMRGKSNGESQQDMKQAGQTTESNVESGEKEMKIAEVY